MALKHENLPSKKHIWVLFDIDNGHRGAHHYLWWFETKKQAIEHKRHQKAMAYGARLVGPVKWWCDENMFKVQN